MLNTSIIDYHNTFLYSKYVICNTYTLIPFTNSCKMNISIPYYIFIIIIIGKYFSFLFIISRQHSCEGMNNCHLGSTILSSQVGLSNVKSQTLLDEPVEITFPMEVSALLELLI